MGLVIQMFFIGAEIEIRQFAKNFGKPLVAVLVQLCLSVAFIWLLGSVFSWSGRQIIVFGFIISLSSSAIILEYLQKNKELTTPLGTLTTGILVLQDFLIVPMLFTMNYMALKKLNFFDLVPLLVASVLMIVLLRKAVLRKKI
jgi:CPA2 family monovalent cation:H+ antiporter-2